MRKRNFIIKLFSYIFLTIVLIFAVFPVFYTMIGSLKGNTEVLVHPERVLPQEPTLENFKIIFSDERFDFWRMIWNSTYYTLFSVTSALILSAVAGYVFERSDFPGKKLFFTVFSSLMFIGMGSITIYPQFEILSKLNLATSLWGLIVMHFFSIGIVNIYLVRGYIRMLPKELDEAAEIDGCGFAGIFFRIILPLLKPIMATIGILAFKASWNDYLMPTMFTLTRPEQRTLMVGIAALKTSSEGAASWNIMLAGSTIAIIPVLIAYAVGNKHFVNGMAAGAVKG